MKVRISGDQRLIHVSGKRYEAREAESCTGCDLMYKHICDRIPCEPVDRKDDIQVIFTKA